MTNLTKWDAVGRFHLSYYHQTTEAASLFTDFMGFKVSHNLAHWEARMTFCLAIHAAGYLYMTHSHEA